jgi:hypothetical protein
VAYVRGSGVTGARCRTSAPTTCWGRQWWLRANGSASHSIELKISQPAASMRPTKAWATSHAGGVLAAGFPDSVPAVTINRFCASSLSGAISLAHAIRSDELAIGLASGVESMSRSGWAQMKRDAPFSPRGPILLLDVMKERSAAPA